MCTNMFVFMSTSKGHKRQKGVKKKSMIADDGMYMTNSVGGKINKNGMKRRRKNRGGGGIIKTEKKCFHAFSSCFPMEKHRLSYTACYNRVNEPGGIWN